MKKIFLPIIIIIGIIGLFYMMTKPPKINNSANVDIIFYYGEECSHCHTVLKYIADNKIDEKIKINSKEISHNNVNKNELSGLSRICPEIVDSSDVIGIPVAYFIKENKCLIGDVPIIEKLKDLSTAM